MASAVSPDRLEVGVTYQPAEVGPYLWHEFNPATVARDLTAIAARRIPVISVGLSWDVFMPSDRAPNPHRMRDLEELLRTARELGLGVVLTMFAQSHGGCIMLPAYAVDRRAPRRGVRCLVDGRVVDGGPRDLYTDPLMLEAQVRWLDAMLAAFAHHPAIVAWDLGHDPASTVRPRRIAQLAAWTELLAARVRAQEMECRLTLGQDDVLRGRGVRLAAVATHVDAVGLLLCPQRLPLPGDPLEAGRAVFVVELARSLAGADSALSVELAVASGDRDEVPPSGEVAADTVTASPAAARAACAEMLARLPEVGVTGVRAASWSDWGERLRDAPPSDRRPWLGRLGIVDSTGTSKPVAAPWETLARTERSVERPRVTWPDIDVASYYANLPDSLLDLYVAWHGGGGDVPAILS